MDRDLDGVTEEPQIDTDLDGRVDTQPVQMGRRCRKGRLGAEDQYWALILAGVGTVEACRKVDITRKTG